MLIDKEIEVRETSGTATLNESREAPKSVATIKRTNSGSIDTGYYLEQGNKVRSKQFIQLVKALLGQTS